MTLRRLAGRLIPAVCCVAVSASSFQDPPPGPPPPPPPESVGTARITGQVVAADTGAPVKRASVSIVGRATSVSLAGRGGRGLTATVQMGVVGAGGGAVAQGQPSQRTDDAGRFEFTNLAAGRYSLMVTPQGGFVRSSRPHVVEVADGGTATVSFKLERTGAVAGRVLDESGDPIARVQVSALRHPPMGGSARMATGSPASTDDLGQFRLFDLDPGQYYISATYREDRFGPSTPQSIGYAPTYYPGTAALTSAQAVTVRSGRDTAGLDFSLTRVSLGRISGVVRDSAGRPVSGRGGVTLSPKDGVGLGQQGGSLGSDGAFVFQGVPPGEYYLSATIMRGDGPNADREAGYVTVTSNGDEQHLDLRLNTGATIRGRVIVEGPPPMLPPEIAARMPSGSSGITVSARPLNIAGSPAMIASGRPAQVAEDGTFELTGVRGHVTFTASALRAALKSITYGAQDLTARPMEFKGTEQLSDLTVVLTTELASVLGTVTNDKGEPAPEAMVIAFPDDPDRWFSGSPFVHITRALPDLPPAASSAPPMPRPGMPPPAPRVPGGFSLSQLLPGRYFLVAIESAIGVPMAIPDRETLEQLRGKATAATVSAGQPATVTLRALKPF